MKNVLLIEPCPHCRAVPTVITVETWDIKCPGCGWCPTALAREGDDILLMWNAAARRELEEIEGHEEDREEK